MVSDQLTFFLSFAAVFAGLAWYLWRLEQEVTGLAQRLRDAAPGQVDAADVGGAQPATPKKGKVEDGP